MRYYFIVNPLAGSGNGKTMLDIITARMTATDADWGCAVTESKGHAVALTEEAVRAGERVIVAVGGDGTVQEVASVIAGTDAAMGIVPCGTGNDYATAVGIPQGEAAIDALLSAKPALCDTCMAGDRLFMNVAGFGFDVDVVLNTERYKKKYNGNLPYMLGILRSVLHLRPMDAVLIADGREYHEKALLISVCNGFRFAGGMKVAPLADPRDGLMDVCVLRALGIFGFLMLLPRYSKGKHIGSKSILYFKCRELSVKTPSGEPLELDGELGEYTPLDFSVRKDSITMLLPE